MLLRIAARGAVDDDAGLCVGARSGAQESQAKVRLTNAGRAVDDGHRARLNPAAEHVVYEISAC